MSSRSARLAVRVGRLVLPGLAGAVVLAPVLSRLSNSGAPETSAAWKLSEG
ncbi:MAG: hypothetical protein NT107_13025 [Planctomycetota bacterium]|nr:hypothetical protein [Planctomycetota bacterium]